MRIDVISIFPELFSAHLSTSLLGRAVSAGRLEVVVTDLREFGLGRHRSVDDEPYGGGPGMVMRPEPIFEAVESVRTEGAHVILLSARGERLVQPTVQELSLWEHLVLICGRYEGVDERVAQHLADREISIGDFITAGGETPALVVIEAVSRLLPGVMGNPGSVDHESHSGRLLEYPQYTRPARYRGYQVPEVLLSGNHSAVEEWRRSAAERITRERRPDLLE